MKKNNLLFIGLFILSIPAIASHTANDSLALANQFVRAKEQMNINPEAGLGILDSIKENVLSVKPLSYFAGEYYKTMAIYLYRISQYDSAIYHYEKALSIYQSLDKKLDQAKILVNTSMAYNRLGAFELAIEYAHKALKLFESENDTKGISISLNIIGQVYFFNGDYKKALTYFKKYLNNAKEANDSLEIAGGYNNIGSVLTKLEKFDSAVFYYRKALNIHQTLSNPFGVGNSLQNIASNFSDLGIPDSAIANYTKALRYYESVKNVSGLAETYVNLGKTYYTKGQHDDAIKLLGKGLLYAQETGEDFLIQEASKTLSNVYEKQKDFENALKYYRSYHTVSDSIFNKEIRKDIEEINTKYETEKKEQQIALQQAEIAEQKAQNQRNLIFMAGLVSIIVLLLVIFLLVRSRMRRQQMLMQREAEVRLREAQIEATISSQEKERSRFAKDLHDGFGQMISILNLNLKALEEDKADPHEVFDRSGKVLDDMYSELKSICFNLMPQTLIQHGLGPAIREFADRINLTGKVFVAVEIFDLDDRIAELQEISLYRIIQEWVNNILKYSDATKISIQITRDDKEITLLIEDDGMGFEAAQLKTGKGNGWRNMLTRTNLISGELELDTTPGVRGNTLILNAQLNIKSTITKKGQLIK